MVSVKETQAELSRARKTYIDQAEGNPRERVLYGELMAARRAYEEAKDREWRERNVPRKHGHDGVKP